MKLREKPANGLFSNRDLMLLIAPLLIEQLLMIIVGFADTIMVSSVGEAAVSGVSLVDTVMVLLIDIFMALGTGGAVIAGQAIGRKQPDTANHAAHQMLILTISGGILVAVSVFFVRGWLISTLYAGIAPEVAQDCMTYITIVLFSIPCIALMSACSALFRTMGDSRTPMCVSMLMNIINITGNATLIYGFHRGVEGVAIPTLVSRFVASIVIFTLLTRRMCVLQISPKKLRHPDLPMMGRILKIALPNSIENSMFQLGKILMVSVIASFGTAQIAANSVANAIACFQCLPGLTCGQALVPIVARCVGASDFQQARYYTRRIMKINYIALAAVNIPILIFLPQIISVYNTLSAEAVQYASWILVLHGCFCMIMWPPAFTLPSALRAAGDVRYCMFNSILTMALVRCLGGYFLASTFGFMALGVWIATVFDWFVRSFFTYLRYRGDKWQTKAV